MDKNKVNRRDFLRSGVYATVGLAGAALIAEDAIAARDAGHAFRVFNKQQSSLVDAITARLIPTTDTPGAREAGVIHFIDLALDEKMAGMREPMLGALGAFQASVSEEHGAPFETFSEQRQDEILRQHENDAFFGMLLPVTLMGFFAMEKHGGNKDHISWKLIDFKGHGARIYPFGHYDAEVHGGDYDA